MKKLFYPTETFDREHRHFGGLIYSSDFNTDIRGKDNLYGSVIASRIQADLRRECSIKSQAVLERI